MLVDLVVGPENSILRMMDTQLRFVEVACPPCRAVCSLNAFEGFLRS